MNLTIRELQRGDVQMIADAFHAIGWRSQKPLSQYQRYLEQQERGERKVLLAFEAKQFAGYLTIVWKPDYELFRDRDIPEVQDFNVLPDFRRKKIGAALMDAAENEVRKRSSVIGIGVGMYPD